MNASKTIFLVDDDEDDRMLMRHALIKGISPIKVVDVARGDELLPVLDHTPEGPKLVLMDMNMPRINGLEMLARLKDDMRYKHIPVVMISTTTTQALITQAYDLGANAFIVKPVSLEEYEQVSHGIGLCFLNNYRYAPTRPVSEMSTSKTIIIVENDDGHWYLLKTALRNSSMKYNVVRINNKERALAFADNELAGFHPAVDMILIDPYLPHRDDGLQLLSGMRNSMHAQHLRNIPIVIFTYSDNTEGIDEYYRHRANSHLVKPPDMTGWRFYFENLLEFWSKMIMNTSAVTQLSFLGLLMQ